MTRIFATTILVLISFLSYGQSNNDELVIRKIVQGLADAWTNGDGAQWADYFSEDHDFITWFGMYLPNNTKKSNEAGHQRIFDTIYKNTRQYAEVDKIKFLSEKIALVHVFAAVVDSSEKKPDLPEVLWSGILVKEAETWKIVSFHNLDLEIVSNENMQRSSAVPMQQMFANWIVE